MLQEKRDFLDYLHKLLQNNSQENIKQCLQKIKPLPIYDDIENKHFSSTKELVANIMMAYFELYLTKKQRSKGTQAIKALRKQLPKHYFDNIPLKTFKQWMSDPNSISDKSLLEMTKGSNYDYSELFMNKGLVQKPVVKGKKLWVAISDYGYHDQWEPTDETNLHLLGVFESKEQAYDKLEKAELNYGHLNIYPTYLNHTSFSETEWENFENSFDSDYPDAVDLTPTICSLFSYDEDMYDDPMDI